MKLKTYFSYDEYVADQIHLNRNKEDKVFIIEKEVVQICDYIEKHIDNPDFGICHGVRNGHEVAVLRERLGINVIGTEIAPTAHKYPNVLQWDFHEVKPEWVGSADFIYSNSLDHSNNPTLCVQSWLKCLKDTGVLIICWSTAHNGPAVNGDCFSATLEEYVGLFEGYSVETRKITEYRHLIFVRNK